MERRSPRRGLHKNLMLICGQKHRKMSMKEFIFLTRPLILPKVNSLLCCFQNVRRQLPQFLFLGETSSFA